LPNAEDEDDDENDQKLQPTPRPLESRPQYVLNRPGLSANGLGHEFYQGFAMKVNSLRQQLVQMLADLKAGGKSIAAYGASAKGSTLLNYFGIGRETIEFVTDRSPIKQGLYTPGTHLPIYGPEKLLDAMPDYVLLLTWNFAPEILAQQAEYRRRGGRFIIPIPEVTVV